MGQGLQQDLVEAQKEILLSLKTVAYLDSNEIDFFVNYEYSFTTVFGARSESGVALRPRHGGGFSQ
jgi:hypothetical protein